ncbi:MAG: DUF5610 domain-containing protein [bacterium]
MLDPINSWPVPRAGAGAAESMKRSEARNTLSRVEETASTRNSEAARDQVILSSKAHPAVPPAEDPEVSEGDDTESGPRITAAFVLFEQVKSRLEQRFGMPRKAGPETVPPEEATWGERLIQATSGNTADRIVRYAAGFEEAYHRLQPEAGGEEKQPAFAGLLGEEIQAGFNDARAILEEEDASGEIGEYLLQTYQSVMERLKEFREEYLRQWNEIVEIPPPAAPDPGWDITEDLG